MVVDAASGRQHKVCPNICGIGLIQNRMTPVEQSTGVFYAVGEV